MALGKLWGPLTSWWPGVELQPRMLGQILAEKRTRAVPRQADYLTDFTQGGLEIWKMRELSNWTVLCG